MRWTPTQDAYRCAGTSGCFTDSPHTVPDFDTNVAHCHPRRKGTCTGCGQVCYSIAMDQKNFSEFYTMPAEVWSSRGIKEALRTSKQWTKKSVPVRTA